MLEIGTQRKVAQETEPRRTQPPDRSFGRERSMKSALLAITSALLVPHLPMSPLLAQQGTARFEGQVLSTDGQVLSYADLVLEGLNRGAWADHLGRFAIELPAGKYKVHIRVADYEVQTIELQLVAGTTIMRWFRLRPEPPSGETYQYPPPPPEPPWLKAHPILEGERTSTVRGRVIERSGLPLAGVSVIAPGTQRDAGGEITDSEGYYAVDDLPAGEIVVIFRCPSKSWGREIGSTSVQLTPGETREFDLMVEPDACWEPTYAERTGRLTGVYSFGFEHSQFEPCPTQLRDLQPKLLLDEIELLSNQADIDVEWSEQARKQDIEWGNGTRVMYFPRYYVDWIGTLTGPGHYGHMGGSSFQFEVDSVIEVAPVGVGRWCPPIR